MTYESSMSLTISMGNQKWSSGQQTSAIASMEQMVHNFHHIWWIKSSRCKCLSKHSAVNFPWYSIRRLVYSMVCQRGDTSRRAMSSIARTKTKRMNAIVTWARQNVRWAAFSMPLYALMHQSTHRFRTFCSAIANYLRKSTDCIRMRVNIWLMPMCIHD